jgi:RimJ/RimL family protein N-acetyltransferase
MIGTITLDRRDSDRPGQVCTEVALGYLFLPHAWGHGSAGDACSAVLNWFTNALPTEPVVLYTQTANTPSMRLAAKLGFTEAARFENTTPNNGAAYEHLLPPNRSRQLPPARLRARSRGGAAGRGRANGSARAATVRPG